MTIQQWPVTNNNTTWQWWIFSNCRCRRSNKQWFRLFFWCQQCNNIQPVDGIGQDCNSICNGRLIVLQLQLLMHVFIVFVHQTCRHIKCCHRLIFQIFWTLAVTGWLFPRFSPGSFSGSGHYRFCFQTYICHRCNYDACSGCAVAAWQCGRPPPCPTPWKCDPLHHSHFWHYQGKAHAFSYNFESAAGSFSSNLSLKGFFNGASL